MNMNNNNTINPTAGPSLQQLLNAVSQSIQIHDHRILQDAVSELVEFINNIHGALDVSDPDSKQNAMEVLTELLRFISSPSAEDQTAVDALSLELPKSVVNFAAVSDEFCELAESVIHTLVSNCNPRDMLAMISEVLVSHGELKEPAYFIPLLSGLAKVFISLKRRHFEHIKEALPAVLKVLQAVSSELDDENAESFQCLIGRAICIATSIREVCQTLESRQKEQMHAILGLLVLQLMALASSTLVDTNYNIPMMAQLSKFLPFCNLSYLGLVTGDDLEGIAAILGEENDDYMSYFFLVEQGAFIAVLLGIISDDIAKAVDEDLAVVRDHLRSNQNKRWQTLGMLKYLLSSIDQPCHLKEHAIDFVLCIMNGNTSPECSNQYANCLFDIPSLYSTEQAIEMLIIHAPDAVLRNKAFAALKMVLADIPTHQRFDILKASITKNNYPSMIAILLDLVRKEMLVVDNRKGFKENDEIIQESDKVCSFSPFWSKDVVELVEFVLRPPKGGPPSLHERSDAVLSALNLYRFILISESTGKTNYTGVLSEDTLRKVYVEWLLPLRTLVSGTMAGNSEDSMAFADLYGLNPVQLVLDRCIELTEDKLQLGRSNTVETLLRLSL